MTINTDCLYLHFNLIEKYILIKGKKQFLSWTEKFVKSTHVRKWIDPNPYVKLPPTWKCMFKCQEILSADDLTPLIQQNLH